MKFVVFTCRSIGTFARALDCTSTVRQPSLHMSAAAASRDITLVYRALRIATLIPFLFCFCVFFETQLRVFMCFCWYFTHWICSVCI